MPRFFVAVSTAQYSESFKDPRFKPLLTRIVKRLSVPSELAGRRLDQAAAELMPEFSRSRLRAWIDAGALLVGGREAKARMLVKGGEELALQAELEAAVGAQAEPIPVAIVHADDALLVIDKPVGLVVHPGAGNRSGTLQNALLHRYPELAVLPRAGLVHRLDKDTSGLLLVARTLPSHTALTAALERRDIKRTYRAICQGVLTGGGTIDAPIGRHPRADYKYAVMADGRHSVTHYETLEAHRFASLLEIHLETGRTHQIRVHMSALKHPCVGDLTYGADPTLARRVGLERQWLHATRLGFEHPDSGEYVEYESPYPDDLAHALEVIRDEH